MNFCHFGPFLALRLVFFATFRLGMQIEYDLYRPDVSKKQLFRREKRISMIHMLKSSTFSKFSIQFQWKSYTKSQVVKIEEDDLKKF